MRLRTNDLSAAEHDAIAAVAKMSARECWRQDHIDGKRRLS